MYSFNINHLIKYIGNPQVFGNDLCSIYLYCKLTDSLHWTQYERGNLRSSLQWPVFQAIGQAYLYAYVEPTASSAYLLFSVMRLITKKVIELIISPCSHVDLCASVDIVALLRI